MLDNIIIFSLLVIAVVIHEVAHGYAACLLGDPTAKNAGRLSLNPLKHVDPMGTIIFPGIIIMLKLLGIASLPPIGWAKPVPVNFARLKNPKRDMIFVALAGPLSNIAQAALFTFLFHKTQDETFVLIFWYGIFINLLLAIFNMVPIPPLDGSRLVMGILPNRWMFRYMKLEPYGILIVMILLSMGLFDHVVFPLIQIVGSWLGVKF